MTVNEFLKTYTTGMPKTVTVFFLSRQLDELPIEVVKSRPEAKVEYLVNFRVPFIPPLPHATMTHMLG